MCGLRAVSEPCFQPSLVQWCPWTFKRNAFLLNHHGMHAVSWLHKDHWWVVVPTSTGAISKFGVSQSTYIRCLRNYLLASLLQELSVLSHASSGRRFVNTMSPHFWSQLTAPMVEVLKGGPISNFTQEFWIFYGFNLFSVKTTVVLSLRTYL